jgi:hypothetical protein
MRVWIPTAGPDGSHQGHAHDSGAAASVATTRAPRAAPSTPERPGSA